MAPPLRTAEHERIASAPAGRPGEWKAIGPYVSERAWGTVREDYSADGKAWEYFPLRARALARLPLERGRARRHLRSRPAHVLRARVLERPRSVPEGAHLRPDAGRRGITAKTRRSTGGTPTPRRPARGCSWRYHYPQAEFPYARLREENARRGRHDREFELADTGVFDGDRYWQINADYAKAAPRDLCVRIRIRNAGPEAAELHVLPTLWFRNRWAWDEGASAAGDPRRGGRSGRARSPRRSASAAGDSTRAATRPGRCPQLLFCENETNSVAALRRARADPVPQGRHQRSRGGRREDRESGAAGHEARVLVPDHCPPGATVELRLRLTPATRDCRSTSASGFDRTLADREREADEYYAALRPARRHRRRSGGDAPGVRRHGLEPAVLSLRRRALARRRSDAAGAAGGAQDRAQRRAGGT